MSKNIRWTKITIFEYIKVKKFLRNLNAKSKNMEDISNLYIKAFHEFEMLMCSALIGVKPDNIEFTKILVCKSLDVVKEDYLMFDPDKYLEKIKEMI